MTAGVYTGEDVRIKLDGEGDKEDIDRFKEDID